MTRLIIASDFLSRINSVELNCEDINLKNVKSQERVENSFNCHRHLSSFWIFGELIIDYET